MLAATSAAVFPLRTRYSNVSRLRVMNVGNAASAARSTVRPPKRVLLTNDDGPDSPFFHPFVECLKKFGWDIFVCIPATNASFVAKGITAYKPLTVTHIGPHEVHVSGSPASCVNLALSHLVPECDLVISGPNIGHNVGRASVVSSGTIGAAAEGVLYGRKGIAVSFPFSNGWGNWTDADVEDAVNVAAEVSAELWADWETNLSGAMPELFNVNVPVTRAGGGQFAADAANATGMRDAAPGESGGASEAQANGLSPGVLAVPALGVGASALRSHGKAMIAGAEVRLTVVDQTSYYGSLYAPQDSEIPEPDSVMGSAAVPPTTVYKWQPTKLRPFDGLTPISGGDVAAIRDGVVSVTPLGATLQHLEWR